MTRDQVLRDMQECYQTKGQSVYQHGLSVWEHTLRAIRYLEGGNPPEGWLVPDWLQANRERIRKALLPLDIIEEYAIFHDCGKPYCQTDGDRRFPDHAEVSYRTWLKAGGREAAAKLMRLDMKVHTMGAEAVASFAALPEAATLLVVGLAEVHSNAAMFGGKDSPSFKMKWKHLDRRGRAICKILFPPKADKLYLVTRQDLSPGQQAIQAAHAVREFTARFPKEDRTWYKTSNTLVLLSTEDEATLRSLLEKACKSDLPAAPFYESDRNGELTAIALGGAGKRLCRGLRLALG